MTGLICDNNKLGLFQIDGKDECLAKLTHIFVDPTLITDDDFQTVRKPLEPRIFANIHWLFFSCTT